MSGEGGTSCEVELVSCSLSELSSCLCLHEPSPVLGSNRRKLVSHPFYIPPEDVFLSAKRAFLTHKPTLIDQLIHRNRAALIMGPKRAKAPNTKAGVKRKREPEPSSSGPSKKLKVNASGDPGKKTPPGRKTGHKLDPLGIRSQLLKKKFNNESIKNPYATRKSSNKVKIPFSLRSGRKMADKGKKKKPLTAKKGGEGPSASGDASKSDDEPLKGALTPGKKEPAASKKVTPLKKESSSPALNQASSSKAEPLTKKSGNKSDAGGSTTSEKTVPGEEVKKKSGNKSDAGGSTTSEKTVPGEEVKKKSGNKSDAGGSTTSEKTVPGEEVKKKSGNKSDAGGSTTSEKTVPGEEVKKKRRKRKRWSLGMNPLKKPTKKKEPSGPQDEVEEESDEDDESGRVSDTSMLSVATHDSSSLIQLPVAGRTKEEPPVVSAPTKEEPPLVSALMKEEPPVVSAPTKEPPAVSIPTEEEPLPVSTKVDVAVDMDLAVSLPEEPMNDEVAMSKMEDSKIDETRKTETEKANGVADVVVVEQAVADVAIVEQAVAVQTCFTESALEKVVVENDHEEQGELLKDETEKVEGHHQDETENGGITESLSVQDSLDLPEVEAEGLPDYSAAKLEVTPHSKSPTVLPDPTTELLTENKSSDCLLITKCESLVNTPLEKTLFSGAGVSVVETEEIANSQGDTPVSVGHSVTQPGETEVPEEVPLKTETLDTDCVVPGGSAEDDAELKRDPDSTTCDNPKGLDDSFGDLSLYVSEEDLNPEKEHDEGLPDSTNLAQADAPHSDEPELGDITLVKTEKVELVENLTEEQKQMKESVLQALGLKSLSSASAEVPEVPPPKRSDGYTGTLKAVIKLNRDKKQMVYKRSDDDLASSNKLEYRICSEIPSADGEPSIESKKPEGVEASEDVPAEPGKESNLIIPEKSSSFSIHPGRLCSDVCSYCFGKFGSLDTPCHVAQLKGEERQRKILENEPHLTGESCLCDACYRYVDRKANFPEKLKVGRMKPPAQPSICCVTHCTESATRTIKRKWLIKLKKSITNKLNIDMEKLGHGVYYPFCTQHHYWVEYFTVCGICRKRLNRNNLFSLGAEADRLNLMLAEDGIPARLSVNLFLCKLCRYYADLRLKYPDPTGIPNTNQNFYKNYRRKILMSLDIPVSDSDDELLQPQDDPKEAGEQDGSKADEDVMSLTGLATLLGEQPQQQARIQVKFGNVNIGTLSNLNIGQQGGSAASAATTSTGNACATAIIPGPNVNGASSHHKNEPTYPEVSLIANLEYQGPNTPDGSWERYQSTLQFDKKTKQLWTELQRPYGSQTSFLRHLVMLERVWRDGYLVLAADADEAASRYITSARNRIRAFETQGPKMQTSIPSAAPTPSAPVVTPSTSCPAPVSRPQPVVSKKQQPIPQPYPFLATGEIEVTPIRNVRPNPNVLHNPAASKAPVAMQRNVPANPVQRSSPQQFQAYNQQMYLSKKITPLDRAKSLVRMAPLYQQIQQHTTTQPTGGERRGATGTTVRYNHSGATHSSIPPLVRLPQTTPTQFYPQQMFTQQQLQQQLQQHINQQQSFFQNQPPIPQQQQIQQKQLQHKQLLQQQQQQHMQQQQQQQQQHMQQQQQQHMQQQQQQQHMQQQQQQQQHQHMQQQQQQQQHMQQPQKQQIALPKLPKNLTVMSMPARPSPPQAITLSHAGITIEKQIAPTERRTSSLPIERPSISVFREPATP